MGMTLIAGEQPLTMTSDSHPTSATDFDGFFRAHYSRVFGLLYRVTGNAQDAEDIGQELFLQLSRRQPPLWQSPAISGWLWKAATHSALNALRGSRRRVLREERAHLQDQPVRLLAERDEDPAGSLERKERQAAVRQALRQLKPRDAALLLTRHSGLSYAEVALALDMNPASVGTLLARAEDRFKEVYSAQEHQA